MKRRIEQLLNGRFEYEAPELITSDTKISVEIPEGRVYKGELSIGSRDGSRIHGMLTTDHGRIVLAGDKFSGNTSKIIYIIDTKGLKQGDKVEGNIVILSSLAEKLIPVSAVVVGSEVKSSIGTIRALEDFARLAAKNQREAFGLFTSEDFVKILNGKNLIYTALYKGMSHNPVTYQHMEEFLIAAGKKEPITVSFDKDISGKYILKGDTKDILYLTKTGWGYLRLEIEAVGDFIEVEKKVVTSEDFIGKTFGLGFFLSYDKVGRGRSFGKLILRSVHQTLEFTIIATKQEDKQLSADILKKKKIADLLKNDLLMKQKKIDYRTWLKRVQDDIFELREADCMDDMLILYEAYTCIIQDDITRAMELLWSYNQEGLTEGDIDTSPKEKGPNEKGLYLYLAKKVNLLPPEKAEILPKLKAYVQQKPDSYALLYALCRTDETISAMPAQTFMMMERAYERGMRSPFLYFDAYKLIEQQENLLRRLSPFVIQVIYFAVKSDILSEQILSRIAFLSDNLKEFSPLLYKILSYGYEKYPSKEVLEAICKFIMKTGPLKNEYFKWYRLAVSKDIKLTRLYEYYIETMGEEASGRLPLVIRMYFTYNKSLSAKKRAIVYANVVSEKANERVIYGKYLPELKVFAKEQLIQGNIDRNFAAVYQDIYTEVQDEVEARLLTKVIFKHRVTVANPAIRSVIVCHDALGSEQEYILRDGVAYVDIYSEDACILFEDDKRRRFADTVPFQVEKLMEGHELAKRCAAFHIDIPGLLLYICKSLPSMMDVNTKSVTNYWLASENSAFTRYYRGVVKKKLLEFYMEHTEDKQLAEYIKNANAGSYAEVNKEDTVKILLNYGFYEKALDIVDKYGAENIDLLLLLKLSGRTILAREFVASEELSSLAEYVVFHEKYDEVLLTYLARNYIGTIENMCFIRGKVKGFSIDTYELDERILKMAMYVREFPHPGPDILEEYIMGQGKENIIRAYLTYISTACFMGNRKTEKEYFTYLEAIYEKEWKLDIICHLALLKFYAESTTLTETQMGHAASILRECELKGLRFAFFKKLPLSLIQMYQVEDKVFVEERFKPGSKVVVHFALSRGSERPINFKAEPVSERYHGIFGKEFLLFYGEKLTYYFTILDEEGKTVSTPRKELSLTDAGESGRTKYKLLNQILAAKALGNADVAESALKLYQQQEAFVDTVFHIME